MALTDAVCLSVLDLGRQLDPAAASAVGVSAHDGRLGRFDADAVRQQLAAYRALAGAVEALDVADLDGEIDRTALLAEVRLVLERFEHEQPHVRDPAFWVSHVATALYGLLARPQPTPDAAAALARVEGIPALLESAGRTLRGVPDTFREMAIEQLPAARDLLERTVERFVPELGERGVALRAAADQAGAALRDFERVVAQAGADQAEHSVAIGEERFNRRLHAGFMLGTTAPELWRHGMHLVEELEAELGGIAHAIEPGRPWAEVAARLAGDIPDPADLIAAYRGTLANARDALVASGLFPEPAELPEVVETPGFLRPLIPAFAHDVPGATGADRVGHVFVTLPDPHDVHGSRAVLREHCRPALVLASVHEGFPGHHYHAGAARHLSSEVRRQLWSPLTLEGWALYAEEVMVEAGYLGAPELRLFQRMRLLHRALRLLVDVGVHTRAMSPDEAADLLVARLPIDRAQARREVHRCCAWPTWHTAAIAGRRELLRLRADARARDGAAFDLRAFHAQVLSYGGLPVPLARWGMGLDAGA